MKYRNRISSWVVSAWIATGGWTYAGCSHSSPQPVPAVEWNNSSGGGGAGDNSGGGVGANSSAGGVGANNSAGGTGANNSAGGTGANNSAGGTEANNSAGGTGANNSAGGVGANNSAGGTGGDNSSRPSDASVTDATLLHSSDADSLDADGSPGFPHRDFPDVITDALPIPPAVPVCPSMVSYVQTNVMFELGPTGTILGSVTPDGLTVAWTVPGSFSPGNSQPPSVLVADRSSTSDAFGSPQTVDFGASVVAEDKVALSPDRLRLVAVRADLQGFLQLTRADLSSAFGSASEADFANINSSVNGTGDALGDPTIAPNDQTFIYTRAQAIRESDRTAGALWPAGSPVSIQYSLSPGQHLRPSAVSRDLLTLFAWNEGNLFEIAAWRLYPTDPFESTATVGAFPSAQPNSACDTLFYASAGTDGNVYLAQVTSTYSP